MSDIVQAAEVKELYSRPSASAIGLTVLCDARAGARYVARLPDPEGAKAKLGTRCHVISADYLSKGTAPNRSETFEIVSNGSPKTYYPGRIVSNILHHLPPAGSVPNVEHPLTLVHRGISFNGSIDWTNDTTVGDHKFTSQLRYAKTVAELVHDPQRILYAADWFSKHATDTLLMQWTYGQFDVKASKPVKLTAARAEVMKRLDDEVMPVAERLLRYVSDQVDWKTLPKNPAACSKFPPDGCPYARECPRTLKDRIQTVMASSLLEKLRAKKLGTAAPVAAVEAPVAAEAPKTLDDKSVVSEVENDAEAATQAIVGAINPPGEAADVVEQPDAPEAEAPAPTAVVANETPKRGRGRPRKDGAQTVITAVAKAEQAVTKAVGEQPLSNKPANDTIPAPTATSAAKSLVLLVDCVPLRGMGDVTFASDLIEQAHAHVRKTFSTDDHQCIDYRDGTPGIDFGKGNAFLVASVAALVADLPSDTVVYLDTRSVEGALVLQTLLSSATTVIRSAA